MRKELLKKETVFLGFSVLLFVVAAWFKDTNYNIKGFELYPGSILVLLGCILFFIGIFEALYLQQHRVLEKRFESLYRGTIKDKNQTITDLKEFNRNMMTNWNKNSGNNGTPNYEDHIQNPDLTPN